jgi:hypothetical protein
MTKKVVVAVVAVVIAIAGLLVAGVWAFARHTADQRRAAMDLDPRGNDVALALFAQDQQAISNHWLIAETPGADASPVLDKHIAWRGKAAAVPVVPERVVATVQGDWLSDIDSIDLSTVDLQWMRPLRIYGHWDLEADGSPLNTEAWFWAAAAQPVDDVARARQSPLVASVARRQHQRWCR